MVSATPDQVLAAIEAHGDALDWREASARVLPVVPRVRPYPTGFPEPLRTMVSPGVVVGFGIDIGPAFMSVSADMLKGWGRTLGDVTACALRNVHQRAAGLRPSDILRAPVGDVPTETLQTGRSIGSTLIMAPGELSRLFGPGDRLFITPMRDLIIGLPAAVDPEFAWWLYFEFASLDPNCLGPMFFRFVNGERIIAGLLDGPAPDWAGQDVAASVAIA